MTVSNLIPLSASDLVERLSSGASTSAQVMEQLRVHIAATNPKIGAFDSVRLEPPALATTGPLHGLPITVKDQIAVAGHPRNFGLDKAIPGTCGSTASTVQLLIDAGARVVGKTCMPPYAIDFQTFNGRTGLTRNPWNSEYTAGGSSGGGAAAVATGMSYLDIGADLSGSLRIPAAFCGVFSLLPSQDATPNDGLTLNDRRLEHFARIGPIARTVDDLMLAWHVMSGVGRGQLDTTRPTSLAVWQNDGSTAVEPEIADALDIVARRLSDRGIGTPRPGLGGLLSHEARQSFGVIMGHETGGLIPNAARLLMRVFGRTAARRSPGFLAPVHEGYKRDFKAFEAALKVRRRIQAHHDTETKHWDAVLLPVCSLQPFKHRKPDSDRNGIRDYVAPFTIDGRSIGYWDALTAFATPVSLIGNPVVTLPIGMDSKGLPIGAQLVGKCGQEWRLLQIARELSRMLPRISLLKTNA